MNRSDKYGRAELRDMRAVFELSNDPMVSDETVKDSKDNRDDFRRDAERVRGRGYVIDF